MMNKIIFILLLISFSAGAQSIEIKKEFKNQGEQENYWAQQLFEKQYKKENYKRFESKIRVEGNAYHFKDKILEISNTNKELMTILGQGLLFPSLIEIEFLLSKANSVKISTLEEEKFLSNNPTCKRFKFLCYRKGFLNPNVYFFELTNENATIHTNLQSFINGATLTFFKEGWSQI